ncbi:ALK1 Serine threonine kinase of the haspin family [Pyrenophora tritici-repentis]|nr:ALK1 Serine-threonine kinase haspin family [Pyrenophora tritici-repentis]KAI1527623.1 ALK1 Serine threonine kinase of the haspin family [Pyrenophora tritici-repentis]KAI1528697.1 ALK1 Serine threonine kinase of the haspin family [Pyrenophora tritici-repentis]KAI1537010.1 ALK1 Serine threonine kinase of the haspin family [Pyrenophora tritici-repentis]KAI1561378.1 ALK1 Serine threonine kinase of the haspin family [Pyrenophora tritici-repentis]
MPPKIVYGKKRTGERPAYTKFLSPEKDVAHKVVGSQNVASITTNDWRDQLLTAAESTEQQKQKDDEISALEKGFEGLRVEQPRNSPIVRITKKQYNPLKTPATDGDTTKENAIPIYDALEESMRALEIKAPTEEDPAMLKKPRKPRKVLSDRNINVLNETHGQVQSVPKKKKEKKRIVPIAVDAAAEVPRNEETPIRPRSKQRRPQLPTPEPTPEPETIYSAYASPLLALSDRKRIVGFQDWLGELEPHFEITKIAEASFSEVYRLSATSSTNGVTEESVLKVVALKTPPEFPFPCQLHTRAVRDREAQMEKEMAQREEEDQWKSHVEDVVSEVRLLQNLTHIPGFTVFRDLTIVQGRPSTSFNDAWKEWNKSRPRGKKSEFPDPSKKASYDDNQLWAVVEMQDAGTDCEKMMENGGLSSIWEVWDVFWGVAISLGKAEEACRFEHRDLHLGNICVRSSRTDGDVLQPPVRDPLRRKFRFTGLETTVIDYTLSRADIVPSLSRDDDPALFQGDASEEYQYEIYRYMRGAALFDNPLQAETSHPQEVEEEEEPQIPITPRRSPRKNTHIRFDSIPDTLPETLRRSPRKHSERHPSSSSRNVTKVVDEHVWRQFHPKTNLVWLHFLLHKLLNHLSVSPDSLSTHQAPQEGEDVQKVKKKALRLQKVLKRVSELLCPVALGRREGLGSVKELVVLALEERWVRVGDVEG